MRLCILPRKLFWPLPIAHAAVQFYALPVQQLLADLPTMKLLFFHHAADQADAQHALILF